jgi:peptidoglycan lytic transglycosylase
MRSPRLKPARAVIAALLALGAAQVSRPAAADDLETLRDRAQAVADQVTALEHQLASLKTEKRDLEEDIARSNRAIAALELDIHDAEARAENARRRYVASAVEVYKAGPSGRLELLLSARSVSELATLAQATSTVAELDSGALERAEEAGRAAAQAQAKLDERKQRLLAERAEVSALAADIDGALDGRTAALDELTHEIAKLEAEARRRARIAAREAREEAAEDALAQVLGPAPQPGAATGPGGPAGTIPPAFASTGVTFEGLASWYGPGFEGNLTANGEIFDPGKYTAASKELPFGTWLYVEYQGRGVVVRINDRGPYAGERILDLSQAAAQAIGLTGVGFVQVEILIKQ